MITIKNIYFYEVIRPLRVVFATAKGKKNAMSSIIVHVVLTDGSSGFGECPTSISLSKEAIPVMKNVLIQLRSNLIGLPVEEYVTAIRLFRKKYSEYPISISGLEVALFRASLASNKIHENSYWGGKTRTIQTDITIPFISDNTFLGRWINYGVRKGFTNYKLKVSGNVERDKEVLSFVCNKLGNELEFFMVGLDGNQGYTKKAFRQIIKYIERCRFNIAFFEQPLAKEDYKGFAEITKYAPFPIILDETVVTGSDAQRVGEEGLAHGVNIKVAKSGIMESVAIMTAAKKHNLKLMIGCMPETMIGLSAAIYLAAGTNAFDYIDLDSVFLLYHKNIFWNILLRGPCFEIQS